MIKRYDELKKDNRRSPDIQFKEFSSTKPNISRLMSEEMLSNDRREQNYLTTPGFEPLTYRSPSKYTDHMAIRPFLSICYNRFYISNKLYFGVSATEITQTWRTKAWKSHLRCQRMFSKSTKTVKRKIRIQKTNTFTIIAMNFVQEQLNNETSGLRTDWKTN